MNNIEQNIFSLRQHVLALETRYQRKAHCVKLLAVTKNQSLEKIKAAIRAGQRAFGESYLQEALPKMNALVDEQLEWHFIGPLQSNKTKKIAENFDWVHSVDSFNLAKRLNDQRPDHLPALNICLQVNVSDEKTKSGIDPENVFNLAKECCLLKKLSVRGLMTIPAPKKDLADQREQLHLLKIVYDLMCKNGLNFDTLSMGMSGDLEAAIAEGATLVRIGTAIFNSHNR